MRSDKKKGRVMRFLWVFVVMLCMGAWGAVAQTRSQSVDYTAYNTSYNGSNWVSYASGYGNIVGTNTSTGDYTLYTTGNAGSAGLTRTLTPAMTVTAAGTVSAVAFVGSGAGLTNLPAASSLSWYGLTSVPTQVAAVSNSGAITLSGLTMTGSIALASNSITGIHGGVSLGAASKGWYSDSNNLAARFPGAGGAFFVQSENGTTNYLISGAYFGGTVFPTGNVGIGTTAPGYTLTTSGTLNVRDHSTLGLLMTKQELYSQNGPLYLNYNSTSNTVINGAGGNVGIGTSSPNAKVDVSGSIISRVFNAGSGTSIDFSQSNLAYTSASCGAFTLSGMQDGGSYALAVKGSTSGTCSFTHSGLTIHLPTSHGASTASKHTYYSFTRMGTDVYVAWVKGY